MKFFRFDLPLTPTGTQDTRTWGPVYTALHTLARVIDNTISGSQGSEALLVKGLKAPSVISPGALCYVTDTGVITTDPSFGYNAVYQGGGTVKFQSAVATGVTGLSPGQWHWLDLDTGIITTTPNPNNRLQLLGVALTTSDLHFLYTVPTK